MWYGDDTSATGSLSSNHTWWDELSSVGPGYGYFLNASKTWLVTKSEHLDKAKQLFDKINVNITFHGLGASLSSGDYVKEFVKERVNMWVSELSLLRYIGRTQLHASNAAFIHGFVHNFSYLCWTNSDIGSFLAPLEECISTIFIPDLTSTPPFNALSRDLFALQARIGGLGITNLNKSCEALYLASVSITNPLTYVISAQDNIYPYECINAQQSAKSDVKNNHRRCEAEAACTIEDTLPADLQRAISLAQEKGALSLLTARSIELFGFSLHKGAFRDAFVLRYGWLPLDCPAHCASFSVQHALFCRKGGFPTLRHNEVRDLTAKAMTEVCHDVCVEPHLQPVTLLVPLQLVLMELDST